MTEKTVTSALELAEKNLPKSLERLQDLIRIPSISTDPKYKQDCLKTASWLEKELKSLGFTVDVRMPPNDGELTHPVVFASIPAPQGKPTVLFYGHYDVQPVEPLDLWEFDPFDPQIVMEGDLKVIRGRGSSDDKGQLMTFIEACRFYKESQGSYPVGIKFLIEGEEESGGEHLPAFIEQNKEDLKCDVALICDTSMVGRDTPAITTGLRGLVGEEVEITCANRDLHSGMYGNAAANPIEVLAKILGNLRDDSGKVVLEGFYDGVQVPDEETRKAWKAIYKDPNGFLKEVGLSKPFGEKEFTSLEQTWARPTYEINGISGGYGAEGFKTVLPAKASAKVSFRMVPGQNPEKVRASFRKYVTEHIPEDASVKFTAHGTSPGFAVPSGSKFLTLALDALETEWNKKAVCIGSGGSIPVAEEFKRNLGIDSLLVGFAYDDDRIHSPNERYSVRSFEKGIRSWIRILDDFSRQ